MDDRDSGLQAVPAAQSRGGRNDTVRRDPDTPRQLQASVLVTQDDSPASKTGATGELYKPGWEPGKNENCPTGHQMAVDQIDCSQERACHYFNYCHTLAEEHFVL